MAALFISMFANANVDHTLQRMEKTEGKAPSENTLNVGNGTKQMLLVCHSCFHNMIRDIPYSLILDKTESGRSLVLSVSSVCPKGTGLCLENFTYT